MTDARTIPACVICRRHTCADPKFCRQQLLHACRPRNDERGERQR